MSTSYSRWIEDTWIEVVDGVVRRQHPRGNGVCRAWHANGVLAEEYEWVNRNVVGAIRKWHDNGTLAKEIPFSDGKEHGSVRQWNREGKLLGEYTMVNGRGVELTWNEDGSLSQEHEVIFLSPSLIATRGKVYDDLGKGHEVYLWNGRRISKKKFLERVAKQQSGEEI